jgi:hypothetical protein
MIFSLDVRRALKGDCMLLHYGTKQNPGLALIDGGPKGVYGQHLRPRLEQIRKARVKGDEPLRVDLLMVSHLDDDHIQGILELTSELREAADERKPRLVQILSLWHNSFDNIIEHNTDDLTASVKNEFGPASLSGSGDFPEEMVNEVEQESDEHAEVVASSLKVLASIQQGAQLRVDAKRLDIPVNPEFDRELIVADKDAEAIDMGEELSFTIVGPMLPEINALRKKHIEWLQKLQKQGKTPSQVLAAYVDKSVPNLSSLVALAKAGGKTMLLTGDARGDKILEGLELIGLIKNGGKFQVDLLKVPHHGSSNNLDNDFFERIAATQYVFSGDGQHGNPERETLEMLYRTRGENDYKIHFTYPIDEIDEAREDDWNKERRKEQKRRLRNPKQKVRPDWSMKENSLRAFFDAHKGLEAKVEFVDKERPHLIHLLDPLTI